MQLSRRTVLVAGAASVSLSMTAACRTTRSAKPVADPDAPLRAAALAREQELLATCTAVIKAHPALRATLQLVLSDHAVHVSALGGTAATTAIPAPAGDPVKHLIGLERAASAAHGQAALVASRRLAPLLGSLAASCAAAAAVL